MNSVCPVSWLCLGHFAATWGMVGVIWFVQIVHYPLFDQVSQTDFSTYETRHRDLTTLVVLPLMLTELATAIVLAFSSRGSRDPWPWVGLGILATIWMSTFLVQVPLHEELSSGFDPEKHSALVGTNWWRTGAWTFRGGIAMIMARSR
ncbi:MAG: hypothetical protein SFV23_20330 [Planctomycetaceae bacterium]|nr:hypothetical protein [Planctomycetaceae bacterium]